MIGVMSWKVQLVTCSAVAAVCTFFLVAPLHVFHANGGTRRLRLGYTRTARFKFEHDDTKTNEPTTESLGAGDALFMLGRS